MAGLLAQADPDYPNLEAYLVNMDDGTTRYVLLEPEHLDDELRAFIDFVLDEPWLPGTKRNDRVRHAAIKEAAPDLASPRRRRIDAGWRAAGGVQVDTPEGKVWIHGDEYELSQRANALADAAYQSPEQASAVQQESFVEEPEQHIAPGFWAQWRYHLTIVGVAAALIAAVAWATLFRGPWTALRS